MTAPRYRAVLFDWDGCLAQTLDLWMAGFVQTYAELGLHPERSWIAAQLGNWTGPMELGLTEIELKQFNARLVEFVEVEWPGVALYPDVRELLVELHEHGVAVGMVTSALRVQIDSSTERHDIAKYFDTIVTVDDVTHHKPHPEPIELALQRLGLDKENTVMVGDSTNDLGAATNAGVDSILVYPPEHELFYELATLQELKPTHVCRSFDEVRSVLLPD